MQTDVTLLQREQRMTANAARAVKATRELVNAVPFLGGSDSEDDYREALELVEYLIEEDDTNRIGQSGVWHQSKSKKPFRLNAKSG